VGVQGIGGNRKSVLAAALARDREVRQAFPDGIYNSKIHCAASTSYERTLSVWDLESGRTVDVLQFRTDLVHALAITREGAPRDLRRKQ
jgi:hypothetical protein